MRRRLEIGSHITKLFSWGITVSNVNHLDMRSRRAEVKGAKERLFGDS